MMRCSIVATEKRKTAIIVTLALRFAHQIRKQIRNSLFSGTVCNAAMHLICRSLSLVLAVLVLFWAGTSMAKDNDHAAADLAEQIQPLDPAAEEKFDLSSLDPLDCPAIASGPCFRARFVLESVPLPLALGWQSILPRVASPPPRRG